MYACIYIYMHTAHTRDSKERPLFRRSDDAPARYRVAAGVSLPMWKLPSLKSAKLGSLATGSSYTPVCLNKKAAICLKPLPLS